jgi:hypothetical protein
VRDGEHVLLPDAQAAVDERIGRHADRTLRRILERRDAVRGIAALDRLEHRIDRRALAIPSLQSEERSRGHLAERPFRAEICDAQRLLDGEARAHHLAEHRADRIRREALAALRDEAVEHLPFALGVVENLHFRGALDVGNVFRHVRPRREEIEDLRVELVDLLSRIREARRPTRLRIPLHGRMLPRLGWLRMPEANVLYTVTAVIVAGLVVWVLASLKMAKQPWARPEAAAAIAAAKAAERREADVPVEKPAEEKPVEEKPAVSEPDVTAEATAVKVDGKADEKVDEKET